MIVILYLFQATYYMDFWQFGGLLKSVWKGSLLIVFKLIDSVIKVSKLIF